jgi:hypothetical protein
MLMSVWRPEVSGGLLTTSHTALQLHLLLQAPLLPPLLLLPGCHCCCCCCWGWAPPSLHCLQPGRTGMHAVGGPGWPSVADLLLLLLLLKTCTAS